MDAGRRGRDRLQVLLLVLLRGSWCEDLSKLQVLLLLLLVRRKTVTKVPVVRCGSRRSVTKTRVLSCKFVVATAAAAVAAAPTTDGLEGKGVHLQRGGDRDLQTGARSARIMQQAGLIRAG